MAVLHEEPIDAPARFLRVARSHPDRLAVHGSDATLTFAALEERTRLLAGELIARGVAPGDRVGIHLRRGAGLVVALLATWRAGAAYVPLDQAYPHDRLTYMAEESGIRVLVADTGADTGFAPAGVELVDPAALPERSPAPVPFDDLPAADAPAYVIFTSGSTGRPKGVEATRAGVASLVAALEEFGAYGPEPRTVAWNAGVSFDASVQQWVRVCRGDSVVVLDDEVRKDPERLEELFDRLAVTDLDLTPSHWEMLRATLLRPRADGRVPRLFMGGEPVPERTWRELSEATANGVLDALNLYGPTECTVDATAAWITGEGPHIGDALPGNRLHVLDASGRQVPDGEPGELCIAGPRLALGYVNQPELTAERFPADPFGTPGSRMYRTGDVVRRTPHGLEFVGRADRQVKFRGYRMELGEIEHVLASHPDVATAVVQIRPAADTTDASGDRLVAYLVPAAGDAGPETGTEPGAALLRKHAAQALPEFMLPSDYVFLDALPLTPNGKLDTAALPAPEAAGGPAEAAGGAPATETERLIAGVWSEVLGRASIGVDDDFFALGGHSLMALRVVGRLKKSLGRPVPVKDVYKHPRLRDLADHVDALRATNAA
ncbi:MULTISPECIES: non-ribosomal peptide synthetase [unclassified Streptomyces]|uniref:non-ribosomal peptide synthetase n=1 Tax=unclassified Streptomyces TaxID=2593676 RepID=UPI0007C8CEF9|nr:MULTISPECIES: non-ribosomal peptide synthetase [unclassified Streptomyces]